MELRDWMIFKSLKKEFLESIDRFYVLSLDYNSTVAYLITQNDDVYAMCPYNSCIGLENMDYYPDPTKIDFLCQKNIKEFSCGLGFVLALTSFGQIYSWGRNDWGQTGYGKRGDDVTSPFLIEALENDVIIKISAGACHAMALNNKGKVYGWGWNSAGQLGHECREWGHPTPKEVPVQTGNAKIIDVQCGGGFSLALTDKGQIYAWGLNDRGELGLGRLGRKPERNSCPTRVVTLDGVNIIKIASGRFHTLALSDSGCLYAFGWNFFGQIGNGSRKDQKLPTKIAEKLGKFEEIACSLHSHISTAMTTTGDCYVWGGVNKFFNDGDDIEVPQKSGTSSLHEAFSRWALFPVTPCTVVVKNSDNVECMLTTRALKELEADVSSVKAEVDDENSSDLVFIVDDRLIFAHSDVIQSRCEYFKNMLQGGWKEANRRKFEINDFTYESFRHFMDYLYKGTVDATPHEALDLLHLASYYGEDKLKSVCEWILRKGLTVENATHTYLAASKYDCECLKERCFIFMRKNLFEIQRNKTYKTLDPEIKKSFMDRVLWVSHYPPIDSYRQNIGAQRIAAGF